MVARPLLNGWAAPSATLVLAKTFTAQQYFGCRRGRHFPDARAECFRWERVEHFFVRYATTRATHHYVYITSRTSASTAG
jgi:hypothetical protein